MVSSQENIARRAMVVEQLRSRGIRDPQVLAAMDATPRHLFVPDEARYEAYRDQALAIGEGQTISQPYIVALMTTSLELHPEDRVLEVGTGSGYQTAVLSPLAAEVYTIEIIEPLAARAARVFARLGLTNIHQRIGDAYRGWPEAAPFDRIIVTAAPTHIPPALVDQLADGGRMVIPVGDESQDLKLLVKSAGQVRVHDILPVRFVPMTGTAQSRDPGQRAGGS